MKVKALALALVAVALSACAATNAALGQSVGTVNGHAISRACGGAARMPPMDTSCQARPLVGVSVTFEPQAGGQPTTVKTDAAGFFSIKLKPGVYTATLGIRYPKQPLPAGGAFADGGQPGASPALKSAVGLLGAEKKTITVVADQTVTADFSISYQIP